MKTLYTAYTKSVMGVRYYFVKQFLTFPDFNNVPDVLENYGMHIDFNEACRIAKITDSEVRENLFKSLPDESVNAVVIPMNVVKPLNSKQA